MIILQSYRDLQERDVFGVKNPNLTFLYGRIRICILFLFLPWGPDPGQLHLDPLACWPPPPRRRPGPLYQEQEIGLKTWFGVIGQELLAGYARRIYREMLAQLIFAASQLSAGSWQTRHQRNYRIISDTITEFLFRI